MLRWESGQSDWYSGFGAAGPWLEAGTDADAAPSLTYTETDWFAFTGDTAAAAGTVRLRNAPASARRLLTVEPADLLVESVAIPGAKPTDAGARFAAAK